MANSDKEIIALSWQKGHPIAKLRDAFRKNPIWLHTSAFEDQHMDKMVVDAVKILGYDWTKGAGKK